jgi:cardiolipin synthase
VDGTVGFSGGICIDDAWRGDADRLDRWRDTQVRVEGPVVLQLQVAFARAWAEATAELLTASSLFSDGVVGRVTCQVMDSIPGAHLNPARLSFLVATSAARKSIDVTNAYFVPDHPTREALREASQRGVRVRLILSSRNTDFKPIRYAGRGYYKELLEAGVEIYEYKPARLHAKTVIVDGTWASIGSANLDRRSFAFNYESNLNIFDPGFASQMETVFERDLALSTPVTLEEWRKRPLAERIFEAIYGLFRWQY